MGLRDKNQYNEYSCFFITTTCYNWYNLLQVGDSMKIVRDSMIFCNKKYQAKIFAYVIMPNHMHLILWVKNGKDRMDYMRDLKKFTSTMIRKEIECNQPASLNRTAYNYRKQRFKIWMDRFDEVYIESKRLCGVKMDYIHTNPLQERWSLVIRPEDYIYSSARYYEIGFKDDLVEDYFYYF